MNYPGERLGRWDWWTMFPMVEAIGQEINVAANELEGELRLPVTVAETTLPFNHQIVVSATNSYFRPAGELFSKL